LTDAFQAAFTPAPSQHSTRYDRCSSFLQQRAKFDDFIECFNNERRHQALDMHCPAGRYTPSPRRYTGLPDLDYPFHDKAVTVTTCGRICFDRKKINLSLLCRPDRRHQTGRGPYLAGFLHGL
jgi:hypothetical protein